MAEVKEDDDLRAEAVQNRKNQEVQPGNLKAKINDRNFRGRFNDFHSISHSSDSQKLLNDLSKVQEQKILKGKPNGLDVKKRNESVGELVLSAKERLEPDSQNPISLNELTKNPKKEVLPKLQSVQLISKAPHEMVQELNSSGIEVRALVSKPKNMSKLKSTIAEELKRRALMNNRIRKKKLNLSENNMMSLEGIEKMALSPKFSKLNNKNQPGGGLAVKNQINMTTVNLEFPAASVVNLHLKNMGSLLLSQEKWNLYTSDRTFTGNPPLGSLLIPKIQERREKIMENLASLQGGKIDDIIRKFKGYEQPVATILDKKEPQKIAEPLNTLQNFQPFPITTRMRYVEILSEKKGLWKKQARIPSSISSLNEDGRFTPTNSFKDKADIMTNNMKALIEQRKSYSSKPPEEVKAEESVPAVLKEDQVRRPSLIKKLDELLRKGAEAIESSRETGIHKPRVDISPPKRPNRQIKKATLPSNTTTVDAQLNDPKNRKSNVSKSMSDPTKFNGKKKEQTVFITESREFNPSVAKYRGLVEFLYLINLSNNLINQPTVTGNFHPYKVYVGRGNNSVLVKNVFKNRWWWNIVDSRDYEGINLLWTQLKKDDFLQLLKPCIKKRARPEPSQSENMSASGQEDSNASFDKNVDSLSEENFMTSGWESDGETCKPQRFPSRTGSKRNNSATVATATKLAKQNFTTKQQSISNPENSLLMARIFNDEECRRFEKFQRSFEGEKNKWVKDQYSASIENLELYITKIKKGVNLNKPENGCSSFKMHNKLENNFHLSNKKALFYNMKYYYDALKDDYSNYMPITFHIKEGSTDPEFSRFVDFFNKRQDELTDAEKLAAQNPSKNKQSKNIWIVKPGEMTNRGTGITVCNDLNQIKEILNLKEVHKNGKPRTYILQQYIERPLLYNKRKFDIRCYMLLTSVNGILKGYWYQEGYIRTSSKEFSTKNITNKFIHLTNDAVQKKSEDYGKYENGNKISFSEFHRYVETAYSEQKYDFLGDIYPKIKSIAGDAIRAVFESIDPLKRENSFEIFGLDFMIDENFHPWLLEVNTNPCLELSCPLLARLIPSMLENAFRIAIDPIFPPPHISLWPSVRKLIIPENLLENNRFELVFDELLDGPTTRSILNMRDFRDKKNIRDIIFQIEEESENGDSDNEDIEAN